MAIDLSKNLEALIRDMAASQKEEFEFRFVPSESVDESQWGGIIRSDNVSDYFGDFYLGTLHNGFVKCFSGIGKLSGGEENGFNSQKSYYKWHQSIGCHLEEMILNGIAHGNMDGIGSKIKVTAHYSQDGVLYVIEDEARERPNDVSGTTRGFDVAEKVKNIRYRPENEGKGHLNQGFYFLKTFEDPFYSLTASWDFQGNMPPSSPAEISRQAYGSRVLLQFKIKN